MSVTLTKRNKNIGIQLLRAILSLWVIIDHCAGIEKSKRRYLSRGFHVPTFFLIAFYFYSPLLFSKSIQKIIERFKRLLIPYILWPLLIFLINKLLIKYIYLGEFHHFLSLKDIYFQLIIGSHYHRIFWFLFILIFLSLVFAIIAFCTKKNLFLKIIQFISIISLYLHYSGLNYKFFKSFRFSLSIKTLGSIIDIIPISVIGIVYNSMNILQIIKKTGLYFKFILIFFLYLLFQHNIFVNQNGFRFPNVFLNIFSSTILLLLSSSININNPAIIVSLLNKSTKFTGGIYYTHMVVFNIIFKNRFDFLKGTFIIAFIIYLICYSICFFGQIIFNRYRIKYLFL